MGKVKKTLTNLLIGVPLGINLIFGTPTFSQNEIIQDNDNKPKTEQNINENKKFPIIDITNKEIGDSVSFGAKDSLDYSPKYGAFYSLKATEQIRDSLKEQSSRDGFYGDVVLNPSKQTDVLNDYEYTLKYRGSGDLNNDNIINSTDSTLMAQGSSLWQADMDLDGISSTTSDKQIHFNYRTDVIPYCEAHEDVLQTTSERESTIQKQLEIDQTNIFKPGWSCGDYSFQTSINFVGINHIENAPINFIKYDTTHHAEFNSRVYEVRTETSTGQGHSINAVFVGDSTLSLNDWYFFEPQTDERVYPGDLDFNNYAHIERYCYFYSEFLGDTLFGYFPILNFYNINSNNPIADPQNDGLVLYPERPGAHPYGEIPLDTSIECNESSDPNNTGWPTNLSSDATSNYSDVWNPSLDILSRRWWLTGEHPLIDTTLGIQTINKLPDTQAPYTVWTPTSPLVINYGDPTTSQPPIWEDNCDQDLTEIQYPDSVFYYGNYQNPQTCNDLKKDIYRKYSA